MSCRTRKGSRRNMDECVAKRRKEHMGSSIRANLKFMICWFGESKRKYVIYERLHEVKYGGYAKARRMWICLI